MTPFIWHSGKAKLQGQTDQWSQGMGEGGFTPKGQEGIWVVVELFGVLIVVLLQDCVNTRLTGNV